MKITITTRAGEITLEANQSELSEAIDFTREVCGLQETEAVEEEFVEHEAAEVEAEYHPQFKRALTSRGTLPSAPAPSSHADDCECSKCDPDVRDIARKTFENVVDLWARQPVEVPAQHLPVLKVLVDMRKNKQCTRMAYLAQALGLDKQAVSSSLQYLRLHGLAYHGGMDGSETEMMPLHGNSHIWAATSKAVHSLLVGVA